MKKIVLKIYGNTKRLKHHRFQTWMLKTMKYNVSPVSNNTNSNHSNNESNRLELQTFLNNVGNHIWGISSTLSQSSVCILQLWYMNSKFLLRWGSLVSMAGCMQTRSLIPSPTRREFLQNLSATPPLKSGESDSVYISWLRCCFVFILHNVSTVSNYTNSDNSNNEFVGIQIQTGTSDNLG